MSPVSKWSFVVSFCGGELVGGGAFVQDIINVDFATTCLLLGA